MPILIIATTIANLLYSVMRKIFINRNHPDRFAEYILWTTLIGFGVFGVFAICSKPTGVSAYTVWLGVAYGAITIVQYIFSMRALRSGSYAFTMIIISFSAVIPTFSGLIWGETVTVLQIVGLCLMLTFFLLLLFEKKQRFSRKWLLDSVGVLLATGLLGVVQKWHQSSVGAGERDLFLVIAFAVVVVSAAIYVLVAALRRRAEARRAGRQDGVTGSDVDTTSAACRATDASKATAVVPAPHGWRERLVLLGILFASGLGLAFNNIINLYLVGAVESAFFFPLINGLNVVANTLFGIVLFKERLSLRMWIGVVIGIVAIVLVCLS